MTALSEYERLEATGLWRASSDAQRLEVILSFGDASLVISEVRSARALAHWSLPAMIRLNPGQRPAIYTPAPEPGEELEIEDSLMIDAIEKVHAMIAAQRPHPGRLRGGLLGASLLAIAALTLFWLPAALVDHAAAVAPQAKRVEIGRNLLGELSSLTGPACSSPAGNRALERLAQRLPGAQDRHISVLPDALSGARQLPGGLAVVGRNTIKGPDTPEVIAGYLIASDVAQTGNSPLQRMLRWLGPVAALRLLTMGKLPADSYAQYAENLIQSIPPQPDQNTLLRAFRQAGVGSTPYAYSRDPSGKTVADLIKADPFKGQPAPKPVLKDADWVALQDICAAR